MTAVPDPTPDASAPASPRAAGSPVAAPVTSDYAGYRLASHFQPIYSLTHHRAVGHEALLRATSLATGAPVPPLELFAGFDGDEARVGLDCASLLQHLAAYAGKDANEWLFLNVHPRSLAAPDGPGIGEIADTLAAHGLRPGQVVIEVLESTLPDDAGFDRRIDELRELGCLVLMEGIETDEGAYTALRCDVDFVQGYHFGRPAPGLAGGAGLHALRAAWDRFDRQSANDDRLWQEQMSPYKQSIELASVLLAGGATLDEACRRFLAQPGSAMCYLLDKQGRQVVGNAMRDGMSYQELGSAERFAPLQDTRQARWSRRAYFRGAEAQPNIAQVTRPYMTLQGSRMCVTVSIQFDMGGRALVLCGDASL